MTNIRKVAAATGDGRVTLLEEPVPDVKPGWVLVEVFNSLVSPGTEVGGWQRFREKANNPDARAEPSRFGYSNAGIVAEVGEGVNTVKPGDRVAAVGAGYALHTDYALIPHNLCFVLPDNVSFSNGSYAMLAATALHALRRGEPEFGEFTAVVGLGIVGQLSAMLYQLAGNFVIGWDTITHRRDIAKKWGIHDTVHVGSEDSANKTMAFTKGSGLDTAVVAFGGNANKAYTDLEKCFKLSPDTHRMGRIIVVGGATFDYSSGMTNLDIRRASRIGPGYHDEKWEVGPDYPSVFMRWTTRTNVDLCLRLISEQKLAVDTLTTHTIPFEHVAEGIADAIQTPETMLGVVFRMK
ncbi:MAG: hypothetical protein HN368_21545 [Spirochaetales bacterium]|nr:hypothetical protein [Spirochaetales bacterium]